MINYDEQENAFFQVGDYNYKIPRLNWMEEEQFLIIMSKAGVVTLGNEQDSKELNIISDEGILVREFVLSKVFYSDDGGSTYSKLDKSVQMYHFKSILDVYEVLTPAIEAISSFLSRGGSNLPNSSSRQSEEKSRKANTVNKPSPTLSQ